MLVIDRSLPKGQRVKLIKEWEATNISIRFEGYKHQRKFVLDGDDEMFGPRDFGSAIVLQPVTRFNELRMRSKAGTL